MTFFEHKLPIKSDISEGDIQKWILEKSYTPMKKWLNEPFSKDEYLKNKSKYLHFHWIDNEFFCANCKSENVKCIWFDHNGIAMGVDETFGEFFCYDCKKFTFVEYMRDSS